MMMFKITGIIIQFYVSFNWDKSHINVRNMLVLCMGKQDFLWLCPNRLVQSYIFMSKSTELTQI